MELRQVLRQGVQWSAAMCCEPKPPSTRYRIFASTPKEGGPEDDLQWRPLRKGIADLHRATEISQKADERLLDALASVDDSRSVQELTAEIQKPPIMRAAGCAPYVLGRRTRNCCALNHGDFLINGLRNRDLQALLYDTPAGNACRASAPLCGHQPAAPNVTGARILQKVQRTHRYQVTTRTRHPDRRSDDLPDQCPSTEPTPIAA